MAIEAATFIGNLVVTNPDGADDYATADDHLRLIKTILKAQFPNLGLNAITGLAADYNILTGAAAAGITPTEFAFLNGVTSAIQTQLDAKAASSHNHTLSEVTDSGALAALATVDTAQIDNLAITLAKLAQVASGTFLGRDLSGTGAVLALTVPQATAKLATFTSSLQGMAPSSGGGTSNFLRADGNWSAPPGGGGEINDLSAAVTWVNVPVANIPNLNTSKLTAGTLPVARGGTGVTAKTGTGNVVLSASPTFTGTVLGAALTFTGQVQGGTLNAGSDEKLKDNIKKYVPQSLHFKAQSYDLKSGQRGKIGYIAQDVIKELPGAVTEDKDGMLALDYNMVLVAKLASLESRITELEAA